ncbi:MAG: hypothetical protein MI802_17580 [Desulfobacterales bacterium]|nr:hypothetical protein [Desulfobacterales bacterium]
MRKQHLPMKVSQAPALLLLFFLVVSLSGCGSGLPEAIVDEAKELQRSLTLADDFIRDQRQKFKSLDKSNAFKPLAPYSKKENWAGEFDRAEATLTRARGLYDTELTPLLKADNPDGAVQVKIQINRIAKVIQSARDESQRAFKRMDRLRSAMKAPKALYDQAISDADTILSTVRALENGPAAKAVEKFPDTAAAINARVSPLVKLAEETAENRRAVVEAYKEYKRNGNTDFASLADNADTIAAARTGMDRDVPLLESDLDKLYQSYTKVLQDMKMDLYVTIKRESWDEGSDYYNPGFATFTRQISPAVYQALASSNLESIADIAPSFGRVRFKNHLGNTWEVLEINPTAKWPDRRHNAATFWIENFREDYFHKYLQETNGETRETDWEKVNPSFYDQNINNLGMAILSKPYGELEPDAQAAPPGMAYVGNPAYGEWKTDENGNDFWSWYGRYAFFSNLFFFPPYYYHYGSWNRWRTDYRYKKPYYGKTKSGGYTFGTRGTMIKRTPRYQNTTFAKTGGFKSGPASVRGGSASLRGGGPKGKGK